MIYTIFLFILIAILAGCFKKNTPQEEAGIIIDDTPTADQISDTDSQIQENHNSQSTVKVYFPKLNLNKCDKVIEFIRTVPYTQKVATTAIAEMLKGPGELETGVFTAIPKKTKLKSLSIINKTAYVDFTKELNDYGGGSCNVSAIIAQIESTLKQFPTIENVVISIEKNTENILQP